MAMALSMATLSANAQRAAGQFEVVQPDSQASAMMMALIDQDNVMIIDKSENNPTKLDNGQPVWGVVMSLQDYSVRGLEMVTNPFCAAGAQLGNGTWIVAGGNHAIGYGGGTLGNVAPQDGPYKDLDGGKAIRLMDPQADAANLNWIDEQNAMTAVRWYPGMEVMTDGTALLIGGATGGGYINRNLPNIDPAYEGGGATPTWEFFPSKNNTPTVMTFMNLTSGLNMYPHTYLMPSGKLFIQANYSTALWNPYANNEATAYNWLDNMPDEIVRVYPASGAVAMLPLTPANNYTPTILFCGGSVMPNDADWGFYGGPGTNMYQVQAQTDCSSITPEDANGNLVSHSYVREEQLPEPRSMGQFIHLPTGQLVIVNGAQNGTAGYTNATWNNVNGINQEGCSQIPTYQPVLYDPSKPLGKRLSREGFGSSKIARLYHSSAILVPDGSVLIGGSNPHQDVSINMPLGMTPEAFNTTYEIEKWYPPYFFEPRPQPVGLPNNLMYGGSTWNFTMDANFMGNSANYKANNTRVMVIRPGFSTHALNMGQRSLQLQHTYTVNNDGSVSYEVMPMPINQNIFVQGPALLFVTIDGVPSIGKYIQVGTQTFGANAVPNIITSAAEPGQLAAAVNNPNFNALPKGMSNGTTIAEIVGGAAGGFVVLLLLLLAIFLCLRRRRRNRVAAKGTDINDKDESGHIYGVSGYTNGRVQSQYRSVGQQDIPMSSHVPMSSPNFQAAHIPYDQRSQRSVPSMASNKYLSSPLATPAYDINHDSASAMYSTPLIQPSPQHQHYSISSSSATYYQQNPQYARQHSPQPY